VENGTTEHDEDGENVSDDEGAGVQADGKPRKLSAAQHKRLKQKKKKQQQKSAGGASHQPALSSAPAPAAPDTSTAPPELPNVEIEYVREEITPSAAAHAASDPQLSQWLAALQSRFSGSSTVGAEGGAGADAAADGGEGDVDGSELDNGGEGSGEGGDGEKMSNKARKKLMQINIAVLKQTVRRAVYTCARDLCLSCISCVCVVQVKRPEVVEVHDVTAADPKLLVYLKSLPHTVPVPRHWSAKRKYLQARNCTLYAKHNRFSFIIPLYARASAV
jgi:splicing factor 3B subunit 2